MIDRFGHPQDDGEGRNREGVLRDERFVRGQKPQHDPGERREDDPRALPR